MSRIRNWFGNSGLPRSRRRLSLRTTQVAVEQLESRLAPSVNVLSFDYGNTGTTGTNTSETQLTPANVNVNTFGKLYARAVDGQVYAEPLVEENVAIGAGVTGGTPDSPANLLGPTGTYNVVFVATEHDSIYAIDTATGGTVLWQRRFTDITTPNYTGTTPGSNINSTLGATAITTMPSGDTGSADISPEIGITGTPVIDPNTGTLYVDVKTKETIGGTAHYVQRLHGISVSDGTDKLVPFLIGDTSGGNNNNTQIFVYGTGDGNVPDPNSASDGNPGTTIVQFNAMREANRPALSFQGGQVYAAWASHGDNGPYHGWVVTWTVSPSGFQLAGWFCTSPNNGLSGIWGGGCCLQFEPDGSAFYFETGNGSGGNPTPNAQGFPSNANYNEALVKVVPDPTTSLNHQGPNGWGMKAGDYFIPYNVNALDAADSDFGSGAPLLLPPSAGLPGHPKLMVAAGKSGEIYLLDRDSLGKFDPVNDNVLNSVNDGSGHLEPPNLISGSLSTPAYYNGQIYWVSGYSGSAFSYVISTNQPASVAKITATSQTSSQFGYVPGSIQVTGNGNLNGIVWVMDRNLNAIHAYDASSLATELWNSNQKPGGGDTLGAVDKFNAPTVANGEVFVGTSNSLVVYSTNQAPTAVPNQPALAANALSGSSINLTWTDTSTPPNTATSYSIEESTDNSTFSGVTTAPAGATSIAIGGLQPTTTYYFRIRGHNDLGYSTYSSSASATTTSAVSGLNFSSGFGDLGTQRQFTMNGASHFNGSLLELTTSGNVNQTASAFVTTPIDITAFQTQFTFQTTSGASTAEGLTFTLQNVNPAALGGSGAALGYGPQQGGGNAGIANSVALKFDLNNNNGEGANSTGLYVDAAAPTNAGSTDLTGTGVNLHSGDTFQVNLNYDGTTLTVTIKDTVTNATATQTYPIGIASTLGSTTGYVGFTGSTGTVTATQDILTWTYTPTTAFSPNAPSGLGATAASATSVLLSWTTNSTNQTSFNLDRATDSAFTQNLITLNLPPTPSSYTDTSLGLAPGGTYYYRLRAFNSAGNSGNSNSAVVTIPLAPPKPTNAEVLSVSSSEIDLQWTDNAGHQAQGYHILRSANHGSFVQIANLPPTSRTPPDDYGFDDTHVTPGTFYDYHIIAYNVSGNNDFAGVNVTTLTAAPDLVYTQLVGGVAKLYFAMPTGAKSFNVYRGTASGAETLLASGVSGSPYIDATVVSGTTYYYYVTAVNANVAPLPSESDPSNESSPRAGGGTFQWTGSGADSKWATAANWMGSVLPSGNGNETLIFPAGAAQLTTEDNLPAGSNAFDTIIFSGGGYSVTLDSPMALGTGGIGLQSAGTETFTGAPGQGLFLVANQAFTVVSGSTLIVSVPIDSAGNLLTVSGAGNMTLAGVLSGAGGLTAALTGTLTLSGANTYSGPTLIASGATVAVKNAAALGNNSAVTVNGTLQATTIPGLPGVYYNTGGADDPLNHLLNLADLTSYAAALPVIATDTSADIQDNGPNWNQNGLTFDYGEDGIDTTVGFPDAVRAQHDNILAIWTGQFFAPATGVYDFSTASDDGSAIFVDGTLVVDNNSYQGMTTRDSNNPLDPGATTAPTLTAGAHNITIAFYQGAGGYGLWAGVDGPGVSGKLLNASLSPSFIGTLALGSLAGSGTVNLGATPLLLGGNNGTTTFAGNITGTSTITKVGTGVLTLSGVESFTGGWIVSAGQLVLGAITSPISGENMASIANTSANSVVINNPSGNTFTLNAAISGSGLTLNGAGTYNLGGLSTFTGATTVPAGATVNTQGISPLGNADVTLPATATLNVANGFTLGIGLQGKYYSTGGTNPDSTQFNTQAAVNAYVATLGAPIATDTTATSNGRNNNGATLDYGADGAGFPATVRTVNGGGDNFIGVWTGVFFAPTAGTYTFDTGSDDGSMLFIDGNVVVNNNFYQGVTVRAGSVALTSGGHQIEVAFYQGNGGYGLFADVTGPGIAMQRIPSSLLGVPIASLSLGSLAGSGTVTLNGGSFTAGGNNSSTTFSGTISGGTSTTGLASFTKTGTGTMVVPNPATFNFSTPLVIATGTLQIGDGVSAFSGIGLSSIVDNGTLVLSEPNGSTLTYNGAISGSGGLGMAGSYTLNLGGANAYTGPTSISPGSTINAGSSTALGSGDVTLPATATLNLVGSNSFGVGLPVTWYNFAGQASPRQGVGGNPPSSNPSALLSYATGLPVINTGIVNETTATPNAANSSGAIVEYGNHGAFPNGFPAALNNPPISGNSFMGIFQGLFNAPVAGVYTFATGSDDGSVMYIDNALVVDNNNDQAYTIRDSNNPFDAGATTAPTLSAGVHSILIEFYEGGGGYNFDAFVTGPAGSGLSGALPNSVLGVAGGGLSLGSLTGGGAVMLNANSLTVGGNNHSSTFAGTISGSTPAAGTPSLTKAGSGTFVLPTSSNLTYTGATAVAGGTLQLGTAATPFAGFPSGNIADNGTLSLVLPTTPTTVIYNGVISGSGGLTLSGNASLQLGGANTYTGPTLLGGSSVRYATNNALPALSALTLGSGSSSSTVDLNGFNGAIGVPTTSGTGTSNVITNSSATAVMLTITGTGATVIDNVPITGKLSLVVAGSGMETFAAANTYTGSTTISGSTVVLGNAGAVPTGTALTVSGTGTLDLAGNSLSVTSLSGTGAPNTITNSSSTPTTLTLTGASGGPFTYNGLITGPVSLVDATGAAVTTALTGQFSTFTGGVTASSGTLAGTPGAFGTGTATLNGGNLDLTLLSAAGVTGFGGNGTGWTSTQGASAPGPTFLSPDVLQITANTGNQANSFFFNTKVQPTNGFTVTFTYTDLTASTTGADGVTFVLQNDGRGAAAVGAGGGALGYTGISPSVAVALNIYHPNGVGTLQLSNGAGPVAPYANPGGGFATLDSGHPINISLTYNAVAQTLVETATDTVTAATASITFSSLNLLSLLGSTTAFLGFTGGTGGAQAQQVISNFVYTPPAIPTVYPNRVQANVGTTSSLQINATSTANAYGIGGGLTVPAGANVNLAADAASTANQPYSLTVVGNTTLGGILNLVNNGAGAASLIVNGMLSGLGTSIGAVGGNGNLTLSGSSTYNVVVGGSSASLFDNLAVGGAVTLGGGQLSIAYANNFSPALGQTFTILHSAGNVTGNFLQGTSITAGNATYSITYNANSVVLTVTAVAPATKLAFVAPPTATAGTAFSLTVLAEDGAGNPAGGFNGTVTLSSSAGADIAPTSVMLTNGAATILVTLTAAGTQTLTAAFTGLTSGTTSITVSPGALAKFVVTTPGGSTVPAGQGFLVTAQAADTYGNPITSGYGGPATVTVSISPTSATSTFPFSMAIGSNGLGYSLGTVKAVGTYTVMAANGSFTGSALPVTVVPGPAVKLAFAAQPSGVPTGVALPAVTVQVQDLYGNLVTSDNTDFVTLGVASGPLGAPGFSAGSTTTVPLVNGVAAFSNLVLVVPGSYTLSEAVASRYAGPNSSTFAVSPLQVVPASFASSPSGFSLSFNAPYLVNSTTPVLYGTGFGASAPVPTVTLTQTKDAAGNPITPVVVEGSLVLNAATNSLTFVETDTASLTTNDTPVLPDGTYVVRISSSGVTGLQALNSGGGLLDGLESGTAGSGDYTRTFTITAAASGASVLWVPAVAEGPGQSLTAPGGGAAGGGYPLYLSSQGTVTSVLATLNYDPALLTVTGVAGVGFSLLGTSTPGHANLQYSGPALPAGSQVPVGYLTATVPSGTTASPMPYRAKDLLHLSSPTLNGGAIAAVAADAVHVVAYLGDGDGSGTYTSNDAVLITRALLQTDTGFAAYDLVDPEILADTDGVGFIPADAPLQVNEAGVGFPTANLPSPPIPPSVHFAPVGNNVDPTLSLGVRGQAPGVSDGTIAVLVNIDDAHPAGSTGLTVANLALTYDPRQFTVSAAGIHLGSVLAAGSGWNLVSTIDPTGQIVIALSSTTPITSTTGGSLVMIDFHALGSTSDPAAIGLVASASPYGQYFATSLQDAQGTFTLTPAPTNGRAAQIEGIVTLRAAAVPEPWLIALARIPATVPALVEVSESRVIDLPAAETVTVSPAVLPQAAEQGSLGSMAETLHASIHGAATTAATAMGTLAAAPLAGWVFQLTHTLAGNAQPGVGPTEGQHLVAQLFQTLLSGTRANDLALPNTLRDDVERVLAGPLLLSPAALDGLDALNGEVLDSDLDTRGAENGPALGRQRGRRGRTNIPTPPPVQHTDTDRTALDRYFAQAAEETEPTATDDY
jgi:autotransporter-associated beta strand protein